ncbi:hypothetical protein FF36_00408 [Frankia torreyi]|uniref:2-phosphosulfolactate phosphatase n=1 Tax=Frankia torreyi TaxID=1856 RepID=A0A0D8BMG9_9ACTN|nr:hypothetical protein FF36_00408 [Frankia torreyi]KQM07909.1 hypothetical protein FF86_1001165 [Frankia sp. CpI1-P]
MDADLGTGRRDLVSTAVLNLGWDDDVAYAAQLDADAVVPVLRDGAFTALGG